MTAAPPTQPPGFRAHADALRAAAVRECHRHGRPDLAGRLARYEPRGTTLVVLGDFGAGKSTLVNTLVDAPVCPVDDLLSTGVPTTVRFGQQPAPAWTAAKDRILEGGPPAATVDLAVPADLLAGGLTLVDAPAAGGLGSASGAAGLAALAAADGALFITSAADELTVSEYAYLRRTLDLTETVAGVLTKTDFYPNWRTVHDADVRGLDALGIPLLTASAPLRVLARATGDAELDAESGYPAVVEYLNALLDRQAAREAAALARSVAADFAEQARAVVAHPTGQLADPSVDREPVGWPVPAPTAYDTIDSYTATLREAAVAASRAALDRFAAGTADRHVRRAAELARTAELAQGATHPAAADR